MKKGQMQSLAFTRSRWGSHFCVSNISICQPMPPFHQIPTVFAMCFCFVWTRHGSLRARETTQHDKQHGKINKTGTHTRANFSLYDFVPHRCEKRLRCKHPVCDVCASVVAYVVAQYVVDLPLYARWRPEQRSGFWCFNKYWSPRSWPISHRWRE